MRLICPNCGAQYEVSADVIPAAGRDVQCSNCGHTWFETPGASEAAEAEAMEEVAETVVEATPAPAQAPEPEPAPESEPEPVATPETSRPVAPTAMPDIADPEPTLSAAPRPPEPETPPVKRPPLDDAIADMLREEAAREEAMRAAEAQSGLERQSEMGLDEIPTMTPEKKAEAQERVSQLTGAGPQPGTHAAIAATVAASRKELLPDIEEINSTLRSDAEREPAPAEEQVVRQKRGFRFGFVTMITFFVVLVVIYLAADQIIAAVPALEGAVTTYVETADNLRLWLDMQVQNLTQMIAPAEADSAG